MSQEARGNSWLGFGALGLTVALSPQIYAVSAASPSLAACHKLWYLHLCAEAGVVVTAYVDDATGIMEESADGGGQFVEVTLKPRVSLAPGSDAAKALSLHHEAHSKCFIARSVNFPVQCDASIA